MARQAAAASQSSPCLFFSVFDDPFFCIPSTRVLDTSWHESTLFPLSVFIRSLFINIDYYSFDAGLFGLSSAAWPPRISLSTYAASNPYSPRTRRVSAPGAGCGRGVYPGVRLSFGAGFGSYMPGNSGVGEKEPRAMLCGCCAASGMESTGATQASVPWNTAAHLGRR